MVYLAQNFLKMGRLGTNPLATESKAVVKMETKTGRQSREKFFDHRARNSNSLFGIPFINELGSVGYMVPLLLDGYYLSPQQILAAFADEGHQVKGTNILKHLGQQLFDSLKSR